jgi:hypothetical protein
VENKLVIDSPEIEALRAVQTALINKQAELEARIIALEVAGGQTPPPPEPDPTPTPAPGANSRLRYQGREFFAAGANLPWTRWKEMFGGATDGLALRALKANGEVDEAAAVVQPFAQAAARGVRLINVWMFESDAGYPGQIITEGVRPVGIKPEVYRDLDALVKVAEWYDLYLSLATTIRPRPIRNWLANHLSALVSVLSEMFRRYGAERRIMAWSPFVEPEWEIWPGGQEPVAAELCQDYVRLFAAAVHEATSVGQMVTLNSAMLDGLPLWVGLGLDYYSASWYDYQNNLGDWHEGDGGQWCALCRNYADVQAAYGLDAPLVIGEFFGGAGATYNRTGAAGGPRERWEAWYAKGYAGALAWSLMPGETQDQMAVDYDALAAFAAGHSDIGPEAG